VVEGVYYDRSPVVSAVQSALHDGLEFKRTVGDVEHDDEHMGDPFTKADLAGWIGEIALSLIGRVVKGSHPWCDTPAEATLAPRSRLVLLSDWGTGRARAIDVAQHAAHHIDPGLDVHVVHLGDTYYSGTPREAQANLLGPWPVQPVRAATVASWALNGNHDMYSGGHGLFVTTLGDGRFSRQRAGGRPTSWVHLGNEHWNVLGLDTAWRNRLIEIDDGKLEYSGELGHLEGSQAQRIRECAADHDRRLLLLSHHQVFAAYDPRATGATPMAEMLADTLAERTVDAWFWGHEHDCIAYRPHGGIAAARAIGHGAVPVLARETPLALDQARPFDPPRIVVPDPGDVPAGHPLRAVAWEYRDHRIGEDEQKWAKHGFAVVDIDGADLHAAYFDDEGAQYMEEDL
jgi:hypothetical protein